MMNILRAVHALLLAGLAGLAMLAMAAAPAEAAAASSEPSSSSSSSSSSLSPVRLSGSRSGNCSALTPSAVVPNGVSRQITPHAIVSDACVSYDSLEKLNQNVKPAVDDLTHTTDYFSYYRLGLFGRTCPFWNDDSGLCGNIACAVSTIEDEADIPLVWRAEELSKLEGPKAEHPGRKAQKERPQRPLQGSLGENVGESCVVDYDDEGDDRDYCVPDDESASAKGDYVSLVANPERFTGYGGKSAQMVWDAIYRHNCFKKSSFPHSAGLGMSSVARGPAEQDFRAVLQSAERQQVLDQQRSQGIEGPVPSSTGLEYEDECLEKRVFFRVVSGMHASINTHICWDYLNKMTGERGRNISCYVERVQSHPERIANLYFNYALVTRAVAKIGPHLQAYTFCTGDRDQDAATKAKVAAVVDASLKQPEIFDESLMFKNGEGPSLKQEFKDNFRNISRIMDCTSCDKCRLWGKLQVAGYGAALKVLFEFDNGSGEIPLLKRTELVALFNLYARLSNSVDAVTQFRDLIETHGVTDKLIPVEEEKPKEDEPKALPDRVKLPHAVGQGQSKQHSEAVAENSDEWDGLKEPSSGDGNLTRLQQAAKDSADELKNVIAVFKYVMGGFIGFPRWLWHASLYEMDRAWRWYIGLYVPPRESYVEWPDLEAIFGHKPASANTEDQAVEREL
ncbi:hypothetical protein JX266_009228 [Neoarthrinium moseri]|nr:hypothetical protein JX266_009228 [Neoarthrinium moseri]